MARLPHRSPRLGYVLAAVAATMWAVIGSLARLVLDERGRARRLRQGGAPRARVSALAASAATMLAVIGSVARLVLDEGVSAMHLSQMRSTLSFLLLLG